LESQRFYSIYTKTINIIKITKDGKGTQQTNDLMKN